MRLRIGGRLIKLLIKELALDDRYRGKDLDDLNVHRRLRNWYEFLRVISKIGVKLTPFNTQNDCGNTRELVGREILSAFRRIEIVKLFPDLEKKHEIAALWKGFYLLTGDLVVGKLVV